MSQDSVEVFAMNNGYRVMRKKIVADPLGNPAVALAIGSDKEGFAYDPHPKLLYFERQGDGWWLVPVAQHGPMQNELLDAFNDKCRCYTSSLCQNESEQRDIVTSAGLWIDYARVRLA